MSHGTSTAPALDALKALRQKSRLGSDLSTQATEETEGTFSSDEEQGQHERFEETCAGDVTPLLTTYDKAKLKQAIFNVPSHSLAWPWLPVPGGWYGHSAAPMHRRAVGNYEEHCVARPRNQQRNKKQRGCPLMIATHLKDLEDENPDCIIIVRHVQRLGFDSAEILRDHFKRYGPVLKVLLSNRHEKPASMSTHCFRLRPSGIALVLMQNPEDVANVLKEGEIQTIHSAEIHIRSFKKKRPEHGTHQSEDITLIMGLSLPA
jgi:hypothetical protein